MSIWDDPDLAPGGDFVSFEHIGDTIAGVITTQRIQTFDDGKRAPQLLLVADDGESRTVTAGQALLKERLRDLRPSDGDHIRITYVADEKRPGGKTLKHWDVQLTRGTGAPAIPGAPVAPPSWAAPPVAPPAPPAPVYAPPVAAQPPAPPAPTPAVDPAAAAAALAALTPAQRAALGLA